MERTKKLYGKLEEIKNSIKEDFVGEEVAIIDTCIEYFEELKRGAE